MSTVADVERSVIDTLDQEVTEYRAVIKLALPGYLKHTRISEYLGALTGWLEMELAVPGIVTAWCEHGLGGWAHITTSCIDFMEYRRKYAGQPYAFCTITITSCRDYDLHVAAARTAEFFGLNPFALRAYEVVLKEV
jgi:hypothetical protein